MKSSICSSNPGSPVGLYLDSERWTTVQYFAESAPPLNYERLGSFGTRGTLGHRLLRGNALQGSFSLPNIWILRAFPRCFTTSINKYVRYMRINSF